MNASARDSGPPRNRLKLILILALVLIVAVAGTVIALYATGAFSTEIQAEPIQTPGNNPFMPPVGTDTPDVAPPPNVGTTVSGATSGLYGGTLNNATCDPAKLTAFLQANPDKATAWASVQGIAVADIPQYIASLTPIVLRSDTAVTNHGFANGAATTVNSVLQAGTAVLVDKYGVPRTRCMCGNPLTPPVRYSKPRYVGATWPRFSITNITIIQQTVVVNEFLIINLIDGKPIYRPVGGRGNNDREELKYADIQGVYTLHGTPLTCSGFEKGCRRGTMRIQIACSGGSCTVSRPDGGWASPHPLVGAGVTWRASGPDAGATYCDGGNRPATITLELTITQAAAVNGVWTAQNLQGTYAYTAPAFNDCAAGEGSFSVTT